MTIRVRAHHRVQSAVTAFGLVILLVGTAYGTQYATLDPALLLIINGGLILGGIIVQTLCLVSQEKRAAQGRTEQEIRHVSRVVLENTPP
jgi:hypothetical protein